jgi:hypothetical protein
VSFTGVSIYVHVHLLPRQSPSEPLAKNSNHILIHSIMVVKLESLQRHLKREKQAKDESNAPPPPDGPGQIHFGPLEQAIMVLVIVGLLSDPSATGVQSILSPGVMIVLILGYVGYRLLERQKQAEIDAR